MKPTTPTACQKAYDILRDIPADKFITDSFVDGKGGCCARGWLAMKTSGDPLASSRLDRSVGVALTSFVMATDGDPLAWSCNPLADVNNGDSYIGARYKNIPVIKDRVLLFLSDAIAAGY